MKRCYSVSLPSSSFLSSLTLLRFILARHNVVIYLCGRWSFSGLWWLSTWPLGFYTGLPVHKLPWGVLSGCRYVSSLPLSLLPLLAFFFFILFCSSWPERCFVLFPSLLSFWTRGFTQNGFFFPSFLPYNLGYYHGMIAIAYIFLRRKAHD